LRNLPSTYFSLLFYIYVQLENHIHKNVRNKSKLRVKSPLEREDFRSLPKGSNSTQTMCVLYHVYHIQNVCIRISYSGHFSKIHCSSFFYAPSILWPHYLLSGLEYFYLLLGPYSSSTFTSNATYFTFIIMYDFLQRLVALVLGGFTS
jgi:hypothetical protein